MKRESHERAWLDLRRANLVMNADGDELLVCRGGRSARSFDTTATFTTTGR